MIRRREFITLLGGAAAWPSAASAQIGSLPVIGHMHAGSANLNWHIVTAFEEGLSQTGYVTGRNVMIEYRWADSHYDRLPAIAADLVRREVNVLAAGTPVAAIAAKNATSAIPIVFSIGADPVRNGLVASLSRPGGNVTGATFFSNLLTSKRLGLLNELVPNAKILGALVNPRNANAQFQIKEAEEAAGALAKPIVVAHASLESEIEPAFDALRASKVDALIILSDSTLNSHAGQIAALALRHTLPTCFAYRAPAAAGGLMSYGAENPTLSTRQAGIYAGRILKGEKPADLPVQQPRKFEFVLNMKTAKALSLAVPLSMQLLADEVIE